MALQVWGDSDTGTGVLGLSTSGTGVYGESQTGLAGHFRGAARVEGFLSAASKQFTIDHPLDPANKYLNHASVESAEMKNVYDGVATLDETGAASIELPQWFEALNRDFRYQLTAIGAPAPELHIAEEISEGRFEIAGGKEGMKVSWQVTGIRKDQWAEANPLEVEQEKPEEERGQYLHPGLHGQPQEMGIGFRLRPEPTTPQQLEELAQQMEEQLRLTESRQPPEAT